jgi:hypothetical protein
MRYQHEPKVTKIYLPRTYCEKHVFAIDRVDARLKLLDGASISIHYAQFSRTLTTVRIEIPNCVGFC